MRWDELLAGIMKQAGIVGVKKAEEALTKLAEESKEPWKKAVMGLLADAVEKYGMAGVDKVEAAIEDLLDGKNPDMEFASLKARSDFLAILQNMEADDRSKVKDFFSTMGESLAVILRAVIAGLMSA
jgi:hypothetical protein